MDDRIRAATEGVEALAPERLAALMNEAELDPGMLEEAAALRDFIGPLTLEQWTLLNAYEQGEMSVDWSAATTDELVWVAQQRHARQDLPTAAVASVDAFWKRFQF